MELLSGSRVVAPGVLGPGVSPGCSPGGAAARARVVDLRPRSPTPSGSGVRSRTGVGRQRRRLSRSAGGHQRVVGRSGTGKGGEFRLVPQRGQPSQPPRQVPVAVVEHTSTVSMVSPPMVGPVPPWPGALSERCRSADRRSIGEGAAAALRGRRRARDLAAWPSRRSVPRLTAVRPRRRRGAVRRASGPGPGRERGPGRLRATRAAQRGSGDPAQGRPRRLLPTGHRLSRAAARALPAPAHRAQSHSAG